MKSALIRSFVLSIVFIAAAAAPTASAEGTAAGESIVNRGFADYNDANGNPQQRVFSNPVTTVVSQVAGIDSSPATGTNNGLAGGMVAFNAEISNTGNGKDSFTLTAVNNQGWVTTIYLDANGDGIWDPDTETTVISNTGQIPADSEISVFVVTTVPVDANIGDLSDVTFTAVSNFNGNVQDSSTFTADVEAAALSITKSTSFNDPDGDGPEPGDILTFAIRGRNEGTATALNIIATDKIPNGTTYKQHSIRLGPIGGTYMAALPLTDVDDGVETETGQGAHFDSAGNRVILNFGDLEPAPTGQGGVLYFQVTVNANQSQGAPISNVTVAEYQLEEGGPTFKATSNQSTSHVGFLAGVDLNPDRARSANPSDQVVYAFTVKNNGNATDTIDLTQTSTLGFSYVFWRDVDNNGIPGTDGDFLLTDTDGDNKIDTGPITKGSTTAILAVATAPTTLNDRDIDVTTITGTSSKDVTNHDSIKLTTTITKPRLALAKVVSPTGNQAPGTELTYTATITNNGSGLATKVVITDVIPQFTTYVRDSILTGPNTSNLTLRSDASDGDGATFDEISNSVHTNSTNLGPGGSRVLRFKVTID